MKNKVSILTPVYNGENYVGRFLDSILNQNIKNIEIEIIIVNDGSKDSTEKIIKEKIKENKNNKINIKYLSQKNSGQAAAIAKAIKEVTGEFIVWADSDDYYELDAITSMVEFFRKNKDADIIRCNAHARDENDLNNILYEMKVEKEFQNKNDIFEDCIFINGINLFTGVYMARFSSYKKNNPELYIYEGREGQNWQLLLPSLFQNKCYHMPEYVYNYVVRNNSHSRYERTFKEQEERIYGIKNILINTINILKLDDTYRDSLIQRITEKYDKELYFLYCKNNSKKLVKEFYQKIKKTLKVRIFYLIGVNSIINKMYLKYKRISN